MSKQDPILITGIHLYTVSDTIRVELEIDGRWVPVFSEPVNFGTSPNISNILNPLGIRRYSDSFPSALELPESHAKEEQVTQTVESMIESLESTGLIQSAVEHTKEHFADFARLEAENAELRKALTNVCESCGNLGYATYSSIGAINNVVELRMDAARYQKLVNRLAEAQRILSGQQEREGL